MSGNWRSIQVAVIDVIPVHGFMLYRANRSIETKVLKQSVCILLTDENHLTHDFAFTWRFTHHKHK